MKMPASFAEFSDALQKARIKDGSFCKNELTCIHYNGLTHAMIGWNANLYDLNLFAQRLASLTEEQKKGMDALLKIKQNHRVAPIPLNQLINLTYNTDICCFAPRVSNHEELGAFLYANEMLSNEAMALLDTTEEGSGFQERLLELLGEQHQEDHGGVFTDFGYAELGGEIKDIYVCQSNETACFHRSDAPVMLEVRKGFFNDPSYDNDKTAVLNLPAADAGIWRAVEKVDAASVDECAFRCVDCLIPFLRDAINNAIDDEDGIEQADEFAKRLAQIEREWPESDMVKYKALLSVVDHPSLQDATRLMGEIDQYELRPEVAQTWGYAEMMFREKYSALPEELFQTPQAAQIGQKMLDDRLGVKQDQLDLLWQLEEFRKKHEHQAEPSDWAIRMCEAFVARSMGFTDRVQWTELLRQKGETLFTFDWKSGSVSDHVVQWCKENNRNWRYSHLGELQVAHGGEWRKVDYFCRDGSETRVYFPPEPVQEQQLHALAEAPAVHLRDLLTLGLPDHDVYLVHAAEDVGWVPAADLPRLTAQGKEEFSALLDAKIAAIRPGPYGVELVLDGVNSQLLAQYDETLANSSRAEHAMELFL